MLTGRFAPSPSGALHAGSLLAAVASYVDARAAGGRWLVRIEDIDPPREEPGAAQRILTTLERHGLHWDGEVLYQHTRHARYRAVLAALLEQQLAYRCACSRARLAALHHVYDGHCLRHPPAPDQPCALRLRLPDETLAFVDRIQGQQSVALAVSGDCVIHRRDGLFAYQLAVVVDDLDQGVTDVVRGCDILSSTAAQAYLHRLLGGSALRYAHVPVVLGDDGQKLSKQNRALPLDDKCAAANLCWALQRLGQRPPPGLDTDTPENILKWAVTHWDIQTVPKSL